LGQASRYAAELPRAAFAGLRFIDSHVHLGDYLDPREEVSFASASQGMLVTAGTGAEDSAKGLALSSEAPALIKAFVGVHPSEAERETDSGWLDGALSHAAGIGEIGLDPKYSEVSRSSEQMSLFNLQLGLAEKAGKPVQVHSRGAERECLDALGTFNLKRVLLHWFQGEETAAEANGRGYYISFGPALLTSKKLERMALAWNEERVLVESDGPVRFAALGGASGPRLVPSIVFKLAGSFGRSFEETSNHIVKNSLEFLSQPDPGSPVPAASPSSKA